MHARARTLTGPGVGLCILSDSGTQNAMILASLIYLCLFTSEVIEFLALFDLSTLNLSPYRPCPN